MDQQQSGNQGFLRNDRKIVCGMFVFYGICILGLVAVTFWGLGQRSRTISVNATSTAFARATGQANATVTAIAHTTKQAQYKFINRFDVNNYTWRQGEEENEYWSGDIAIESGVYVWEVKDVKETFVSWADYGSDESIHDFDVYVDIKVVSGDPGDTCAGLIFRKAPSNLEKDDYYYFSLCNNAVAHVSYHSETDGWQTLKSISSYSSFPYSDGWNRLEVSARDSHFTFFINGSQVYEMDDDRRKTGGIALVIEMNEKTPARIAFDNFGFQPR